jgi:response regulator NasT
MATVMTKRSPRWRVAIVDDHVRSRAAIRAAVWAAGGEVVGEAARRADAPAMLGRTRPDVVVVAVGLPDGDGVETAAEITQDPGCPVVLLTSHTRDELVTRARDAGVMAYLLKPLRAAELAPTLDLAVARFAETRTLRRTLAERKVIERAKGLLMERLNLTEDEAFRRLRRAAMNSRRPMADLAQALLVSESIAEGLPTI